MWYSRKEEYVFRIPTEYHAYLDFKEELKAAGIRFVEEGGHSQQTILIHTTGTFSNPGDIYKHDK